MLWWLSDIKLYGINYIYSERGKKCEGKQEPRMGLALTWDSVCAGVDRGRWVQIGEDVGA